MNKVISNIKIEKFFNDEQNEDLKKDYMGFYSMDSITRYINFYEIIKKRNANIMNPEHIGGVLWTFTPPPPKKKCYMTVLV